MVSEQDPSARAAAQTGRVRRPTTVTCVWCQREVPVPARGRVPQWCGTSCRHRAWEQRRAAESGRAATEVVERVVTVEVPLVRTVTEHVQLPPRKPTGSDWAPLLAELSRQLDTGLIYPRDLAAVTDAVNDVVGAINRRVMAAGRHRAMTGVCMASDGTPAAPLAEAGRHVGGRTPNPLIKSQRPRP